MIIQVYSIRDNKAAAYGSPFVVANPQVAKRMVADMLAEKRSLQARHPEDFDLYAVASFDDVLGKVIPLDAPEHICTLLSLSPVNEEK